MTANDACKWRLWMTTVNDDCEWHSDLKEFKSVWGAWVSMRVKLVSTFTRNWANRHFFGGLLTCSQMQNTTPPWKWRVFWRCGQHTLFWKIWLVGRRGRVWELAKFEPDLKSQPISERPVDLWWPMVSWWPWCPWQPVVPVVICGVGGDLTCGVLTCDVTNDDLWWPVDRWLTSGGDLWCPWRPVVPRSARDVLGTSGNRGDYVAIFKWTGDRTVNLYGFFGLYRDGKLKTVHGDFL
jgi:hypothetical protein